MEDKKEKILFISTFDKNKNFSGINKKILSQYNSLKKALKNGDVYMSGLEIQGKKRIVEIYNLKEKKIYKNSIEFFTKRWIFLNNFIKKNDINIVYIRYEHFSSPSFISFLKKNKNLKIILEIPTYPYDQEYKKRRFLSKVRHVIDKIYRKKIIKYVDKIVTFSPDKKIWGIDCINISNGITLEEIKVINKKQKKEEKIVFTSVSSCEFWHGLDRFLNSLEKYGEQKIKKDLIFNIIGEGNELANLKNIISKSEYLSKVVKIKGFKMGKELDEIYNKTDIGIGSLARHRSGLQTMRALKNREYCAKGIPMIFSEDDPDLREVSFAYRVTPDEELIDIVKVIEWYKNIDLKPEDIREYAKQFSWDIQMKKVLNEIKNKD